MEKRLNLPIIASIDYDGLYTVKCKVASNKHFQDMTINQFWYFRKGEQVQGPFPPGLISRHIVLGRLQLNDEVRVDGEIWTKISDNPELIPQVLNVDPDDEMGEEKLKAARRWADEREVNLDDYNGDNRRDAEGIESEEARLARFRAKMAQRDIARRKRDKIKYTVNAILLFIGLAVLIPVGIYYASIEKKDTIRFALQSQANCNTPVGPDINWDHCQIQGIILDKQNISGASLRAANMMGASLSQTNLFEADLSYANLSSALLREAKLENATLKGTSLRGAIFIDANLRNADLSYADLTGADLTGANLANTRFDHAIWVNRVVCAAGSIGGCIPK